MALADFSKAIKLNPNNAKAYNNRGNVYSNNKKYDLAIADFSKAIELNPNNPQAYYNRGVVEFYSGKKDAACKDMKKAANLGSQQAADALPQICK